MNNQFGIGGSTTKFDSLQPIRKWVSFYEISKVYAQLNLKIIGSSIVYKSTSRYLGVIFFRSICYYLPTVTKHSTTTIEGAPTAFSKSMCLARSLEFCTTKQISEGSPQQQRKSYQVA